MRQLGGGSREERRRCVGEEECWEEECWGGGMLGKSCVRTGILEVQIIGYSSFLG